MRAALDERTSDPKDRAAEELAVTYARDIDYGGDVAKVGPALLACLSALLLTPAARASAMKGVSSDKPANRLDELRERRARKGRAADLDTAAT